MEGCRKGGHSHTNPLTQGSRAPLLCTRKHTVWGGGHPSTEPGRPVGRARALLLIFFHLVLATSFLVPARRHTEDHYCKVLQETLQQTDLRTLGELSLWGRDAHSSQAALFSEPSRGPGAD